MLNLAVANDQMSVFEVDTVIIELFLDISLENLAVGEDQDRWRIRACAIRLCPHERRGCKKRRKNDNGRKSMFHHAREFIEIDCTGQY